MLGTVTIIFSAVAAVLSAGSNESDIQKYEKRLDAFNAAYGTNYEIPDDDYARDFYETMSFAEFDNYIMSVYDGSIFDTERPSIYGDIVDGTLIIEENVTPSPSESEFKEL